MLNASQLVIFCRNETRPREDSVNERSVESRFEKTIESFSFLEKKNQRQMKPNQANGIFLWLRAAITEQ